MTDKDFFNEFSREMNLSEQNVHFFSIYENLQTMRIVIIMITLIRFIQINWKFNLKIILFIKFIDLIINIIGQGDLITNKNNYFILFKFIWKILL